MVKDSKKVEEFKVLQWIEKNFRPEFINVEDYPQLAHGKIITDRNNDIVIVYWDSKKRKVSYTFTDETGNIISTEKKIFMQVYQEYAQCFNDIMERLEENNDTKMLESVKMLDNLSERLRIAETNLIMRSQCENK